MSREDRPPHPLPTRVAEAPALPTSYHEVVDRGLRELGMDLTPEARAVVDGHARLLLAWTQAVNLTAIREPADVARLHVIDSLAGLAAVAPGGVSPGRILDLGSGGGYPGIVLAAALPTARVVLVDSVGKKARFLQVVIEAVGLADRVQTLATRSETLASEDRQRGMHDVVVVRAVGPLAELVELSLPLLRVGGRLVAWKRGDLTAEIAAARPAITALGGGQVMSIEVPVSSLPDHVVVIVSKEAETPPGYPRDPAARRRRPL